MYMTMLFICVLLYMTIALVHPPDEVVDELLPVAIVTALDPVVALLAVALAGRAELEGPEEVGGLFEVGSHGVDLMYQILHTDDTTLAQCVLNDGVVRDGDAAAVLHLGKASLVDELTHRLEVGVPPGDVRLHQSQHLESCLVETDEDAIVDLPQAQELEDLAYPGADSIDTADPDDEGQPWLILHVVVAVLAGLAVETDGVPH